MLSERLRAYAQERWDGRTGMQDELAAETEKKLRSCTPDEQVLMKYFYGTMPVSDAGGYEFEVFLGFVRHSLMLRGTMEWCRKLPEEIFLHYVLNYRVNNEKIEDCRRFFYDRLIDRIQNKTALEAVIEINYWCAENAAYEASDDRTISPLSLYRAGAGRCGEESVFAVTAFRSAGIPARQVYTPRWGHCDDNHAWVEVYVGGEWHFLGACEPEEVLDRGWFVNASSRTLMVHAKEFSDYGRDDEGAGSWQEGCVYYQNRTSAYTDTVMLRVKVTEADGTPAENAGVFVEALNSAEYSAVARLITDAAGEASIVLGKGTVHLWAVKENRICEALIHTAKECEVRLVLEEECRCLSGIRQKMPEWSDMDIEAPKEAPGHALRVKESKEASNGAVQNPGERKAGNRERLLASSRMRMKRIEGYYREELAERYPEEKEILRFSAGNFDQIYEFLDRDDNPDRKGLLHCLSKKDYKDAKADVLERHLKDASRYRAQWEERGELDIYTRYILCPRIYDEELTCYREAIWHDLAARFGGEAVKEYREFPERIWKYISEEIRYDESRDYDALYSAPAVTWKLGFGNPASQRILCAAICRTLGIPARLNRQTGEAEVYRDGCFVRISGTEEEHVTLTLTCREEDEWNYYQNWTIGQYRRGRFETLDHTGLQFDGTTLRLSLTPGVYRILTANRLPNGCQLASECKLCLEAGRPLSKEMHLRTGGLKEMLVSNQLEDFDITEAGVIRPVSALVGECTAVLAFLEPGEEPTEHVLNEMLEYQEAIRRADAGICFVLREDDRTAGQTGARPENQRTPAWEKVIEAFPKGQVVYGAFDEIVEPLARRMYVEPDKLPLLLLLGPGLTGIYGLSGYRVGSVKMLLELLRVSREQGLYYRRGMEE